MNCAVEYPSEEIIILRLSGRLDAEGLNTIKADLSTNQRLRYAIADMSQTTFIDSLGLAALVSILKLMRSRGGDFHIANPTDVVRLVLELTRMDLAFFIAEDIDAALKHLAQNRQ